MARHNLPRDSSNGMKGEKEEKPAKARDGLTATSKFLHQPETADRYAMEDFMQAPIVTWIPPGSGGGAMG